MSDTLWKQFAYGFFIVNTVCIVILFELIVFGRLFISLFLLILGLMIALNLKIFKGRHKKRTA